MTAPTDHRCAAGRACRDPIVEGDTRAPAIVVEQRGLCRRCTSAVGVAVEALESDFSDLAGAVGARRTGPRDFVTGTPEPPIPLNVTADALARSLAEWADAALGAVAAALGIDHPVAYKGRGYPTVRRNEQVIKHATRVVAPNVERLLAAPPEPIIVWDRSGTTWRIDVADGIDIGLQLVRCHRHVTAVLGDADPRERLAMPCPVLDCGATTLGRSNGSTDITCTTCGGRWTEREYAWLAGLLVADIQREEREADMLEWLLAEARWQRDVNAWLAAERLARVRKVAGIRPDDVGALTAMDIVTLVREQIA